MPTPTTDPAAPRAVPPEIAAAPPRPEPCPNRATCRSPICKRDWAFLPVPDTEH